MSVYEISREPVTNPLRKEDTHYPKELSLKLRDDCRGADALRGAWVAKRGGGTFSMTLNADNTFSWKYEERGKSQEVAGVWGIDEAGVLALEMNDEGTLLAQVVLTAGKLDFYMLGDTQGKEPLQFSKK